VVPFRLRDLSRQSFFHKTTVEHSCESVGSCFPLCDLQLTDQLASRLQQYQPLLKQIQVE
jgi:hypothetical protein